jgi:hypothetical protein
MIGWAWIANETVGDDGRQIEGFADSVGVFENGVEHYAQSSVESESAGKSEIIEKTRSMLRTK